MRPLSLVLGFVVGSVVCVCLDALVGDVQQADAAGQEEADACVAAPPIPRRRADDDLASERERSPPPKVPAHCLASHFCF